MASSTRNLPLDLRRIARQAHELAAREPVLSNWLAALFDGVQSLGDVMARLLASHLANAYVSEDALQAVFASVMASDSGALESCMADIDAVLRRDPACTGELAVILHSKGFHALQVYRISHSLWLAGREELARYLHGMACRIYAVDIHPACRIGPGVMLDHATGIVIGETARVEEGVSLLQGVTLGGTGKHKGDRHPKVKSGVLLGAGATVLGNVQIGVNARVAAGSVVLYDVPAATTVAGIPAQIVRQHNDRVPAEEMNQLPSA